ncbi:MAG TPA: HupE/UreJ family protein, partial [Paracoccaceae bacterium]|nr:HupE/UreJ family protein [Paracoccaceae bacterium]
DGEFDVLWKTPMRGDLTLSLQPAFSGPTGVLTPAVTRRVAGAALATWRLHAPVLRGQTVTIAGLEATMTDALVRVEFLDGALWVRRLTPAKPAAAIPDRPGALALARTYLALGTEHILTGPDHLLFILGLLLITGGGWRIVKTVTAFTAAHSLTLGLAALGVARLPLAPLEAVIALSILFLGPEIVRVWRGETSLTIRRPWLVAFAFGLLHGFGFATGLSLDGMARDAIPQALLWFNVGVELGQLAFIGLALGLHRAFRLLAPRWPLWLMRAPGYAVGIAGAFWVIQRTSILLAGKLG